MDQHKTNETTPFLFQVLGWLSTRAHGSSFQSFNGSSITDLYGQFFCCHISGLFDKFAILSDKTALSLCLRLFGSNPRTIAIA